MSMFPTRRAGFLSYPDNLDDHDRQTYRRWLRGLFAFYSIVIIAALMVGFAYPPARDLTASIGGKDHPAVADGGSDSRTRVAAEKK